MVGFYRTHLAAISAATLVKRHESEPLRRGERALRGKLASAIVLPSGETNLRVLAVVLGGVIEPLFAVARVVQAILFVVLLRVSDPPTTHGLPRLFGIQLEPRASVSALVLRVPVRHIPYVANTRRRVNRTAQNKTRATCPGLLLRGKDSNLRPSGYEPDELPLLHPAMSV
jgi:hypothetical protein